MRQSLRTKFSLYALAQLVGRGASEREREDAVRFNFLFLDQVAHAPCERQCFTRSWSGEQARMPTCMARGYALIR